MSHTAGSIVGFHAERLQAVTGAEGRGGETSDSRANDDDVVFVGGVEERGGAGCAEVGGGEVKGRGGEEWDEGREEERHGRGRHGACDMLWRVMALTEWREVLNLEGILKEK